MRTKFIEFVELIGRIAVHKFYNSDIEDLPLAKRVEMILDEIFE